MFIITNYLKLFFNQNICEFQFYINLTAGEQKLFEHIGRGNRKLHHFHSFLKVQHKFIALDRTSIPCIRKKFLRQLHAPTISKGFQRKGMDVIYSNKNRLGLTIE